METSAIMLYLLKEFDQKDTFGFRDELERSQCLQWLFFWHGSVSCPPTTPQAPIDNTKGTTNRRSVELVWEVGSPKGSMWVSNRGLRYSLLSSTAVAIDRFRKETLRIFGVLELQLSGKYTGEEKDYLSGNGRGKYSVADIAAWRKYPPSYCHALSI